MEKKINVEKIVLGHAHKQYEGSCSKNVTVEDIKKEFYHPNFGGRSAWVRNCRWGVIRHED